MKNKKHIYMLLIFLVFMISISAVSAADDTASDITSIDDDEEIILEETQVENNLNEVNEELIFKENNEEILNVEEETDSLSETPGNFRDLENLINNNPDSEITLDRNYTYSTSDELSGGVTINRAVTIDGNGFTINGDAKARIFIVTNSSVVFKNIHFLGGESPNEGYGGAILGECTAINCTFTSNHAYGGNGGAMSGGTAIDCNFTDNYASGRFGNGNGGAISEGTAINCTFTGNQGNLGGAIYYSTARNCTFINNNGRDNGGAMIGGTAINCHFENNTIGYGSEDQHNAISEAFALNCTFVNNEWDYESTVVNNAYFVINNFTGKMGDEENFIIMRLNGILGDEVKEIYDLDCTLRVYKDGELYETRYLKTSREWEIDLPTGNYTATVEVNNIPEIEMANFTIKLTKNPSEIIVENITAVYKNETTLKVIFENKETYWPIMNSEVSFDIDGNVTTVETNNRGCIFIPLKDLSIGEHNATFSLVGHNEYEDISKTITITIIKIPTVIECENPFFTIYNTTEYFEIRLTDIYGNPMEGMQLDISLFPDGFFPTNETGYAYVSPYYLRQLTAGNYTTEISFSGTTWDIYGPAETKNITIVIEKQKAFLNTADVNTTFNSDDKITATLINEQGNPISGAALTIDLFEGETFTTDENGQIEVPTNRLPVGTYETKIIFNGNENYEYAGYRIFVTINKRSTQLFAENITTSIDNESNLTITLKDDQNRPIANAPIIVGIEDFEEKITDANGEVKISTKDLEINKYNVFIIFNGNENYTASNMEMASITVKKANAVIGVQGDMNLDYGDNATVTVSLMGGETPVNGTVIVTVNNVNYAVDVTNGEGEVNISGLIPNKYSIAAKFLGNDYYAEAEFDGEAYIDFNKYYADFDIIIPDGTYGENLTIIVENATDSEGNKLNGIVSGLIYDKDSNIVGYVEVKVTDGSGRNVTAPSLAGNLHAILTFFDDDMSYKSKTIRYDFTVAKLTSQIVYENMTTTAVDVDTDGRVGEYFYITLTDSKGNALANKFVQIGFNGNVYNRTTDNDGKTRLQINLKNAGTYTFAVAFLGDENYNGSFIVAKIVVNKQKGSLTVPNKSYSASATTKTLTATFKSASGKAVKGKKVSFTVNGKTYSATTDEKGVAKVNVSLNKKGTYSFTAKFAGNNMYEAISKTAKLTIK